MFSKTAWEATTSSEVKVRTCAGWSSAMRWPTRAPRSWPTTWKRSKPSAAITSTWSRAEARLQWSSNSSEAGLLLSP